MSQGFHSIVTHQRPHIDEIVGIWLLKKFGRRQFPGIETAKINFWINGNEAVCSSEEYEKSGVILVGVGGGRFDEHPSINGRRKEEDCAATLIARAIGEENNPALKPILKWVLAIDTQGGSQPFDISSIIKLLYDVHPAEPEKVIEWGIEALNAKYREQETFQCAGREFRQAGTLEELTIADGQKFKLAGIISDNPQVSKYIRYAHRDVGVIIQKSTLGNAQVFTNKRYKITLKEVAQIIRFAEQQTKGKFVTKDWRQLGVEGKVAGAEEWFYHLEGQMLLNGSITATGVPPTKLSLEQIKGLVRIGINPEEFEPSRAPNCKNGNCTSTRQNQCPWYTWMLHRCRHIRYLMNSPAD